MVEAGDLGRLRLGQAVLGPAQLDGLHEERHVPSQRPHGLEALPVLAHLLRCIAVHHVPVLAAGDGHAGDGEVLVQHVEAGGVAAAAAGHHRRAHLHGQVPDTGAVKQPVHKGDGVSGGGGIVYRRADDQRVCLQQLGRRLVHRVVVHALSQLAAGAAAGTAADDSAAGLHDLGFDALGLHH